VIDLPQHIHEVLAQATCLYTKKQVEAALDRMAEQINERLVNSNPIFLCVVLGGIVPLGNLLPRLNFPLEIDYVHASRYHNDTTGKNLVWKGLPALPLQDRTVIVVDDILDGGLTLQGVLNYCIQQRAKQLYTAVLVDKVSARLPGGLAQADFTGLPVDNHYVFGYGMDYKGYLRNAPGIYRVAPQHE
jgi:hypoxanthine phosphoribosyltransferase